MAKKPKPLPKTIKASAAAPADQAITSRGWKTIASGVALILSGFVVLSKADPLGRNWASDLSPALILGGYALIALGVFIPAAAAGGKDPQSLPSAPPTAQP